LSAGAPLSPRDERDATANKCVAADNIPPPARLFFAERSAADPECHYTEKVRVQQNDKKSALREAPAARCFPRCSKHHLPEFASAC